METKKIRNLHKSNLFNEGIAFFPLFGTDIAVYVDFDAPLHYADKCVEHLENLSDGMIDALCKGSVNYCESFRDLFDELEIAIPEGIKGRDILPYIEPKAMIIENPLGNEPAFHMECACKWEIEHAMEWSVRGNTVLFVGEFADESPWRDIEYFRSNSWNYAEL